MANGLRASQRHFYHEACAAQLARSSHWAVLLVHAQLRCDPTDSDHLLEEEAEESRLATLIKSMHV